MLEDAFEMSFIERQRKEEDHLAYLLLGSTEVETEKYIEDLNYEVATVGKLYMEKYGTEQQDANFVGRQLGEALSSDDVVQKQFVIVIGIYMEKEYTYRFLPEHPDDEHPVLVNPRRFVHFVKDKLPEAIYQLCNGGNYCGLAEFMDDIRPSYIM